MSNLLQDAEVVTQPTELQSLEEKIYRTIELLKSAREGKAAAERDLARVREQLEQREEELEGLRGEMTDLRRKRDEEAETLRGDLIAMRKEREEVRSRVEKLMKQIDQLTEAEV